jgi:hypothetical protein
MVALEVRPRMKTKAEKLHRTTQLSCVGCALHKV